MVVRVRGCTPIVRTGKLKGGSAHANARPDPQVTVGVPVAAVERVQHGAVARLAQDALRCPRGVVRGLVRAVAARFEDSKRVSGNGGTVTKTVIIYEHRGTPAYGI